MSCCSGATSKAELFPPSSGVCWSPPLAEPLVWLVWTSSGEVWNPPLFMLVLGPLGQGSGAGQCQILCVSDLGLLVWNHCTIHWMWLCLLDRDVCRRDQYMYKGQLPAALSWGKVNERFSEVSIYLLATPPPPEVAFTSFRAFQKITVVWVQDGHAPMPLYTIQVQ